ncbi:MAG: pyridoxamine 5'-phosphate oxidase family protein [Selenomonadaceae bacterium]|nr:pyridoxamine 5'-phosphate oxidase family protein [Selenomonadaceae bacterium]
MFREMRRIKCKLSDETAEKILLEGFYGILALSGENNYPYAVPINYAYADGKIYFHSATTGHKIDAIKNNPKASFCVVDKHEVVAEEFTSYYSSVIAFGKMRIADNDEEKILGLKLLAEKYSPNESYEHRDKEIYGKLNALVVPVLEIEHLTGKAARELIRRGDIK